jgi:hypothetical protein
MLINVDARARGCVADSSDNRINHSSDRESRGWLTTARGPLLTVASMSTQGGTMEASAAQSRTVVSPRIGILATVAAIAAGAISNFGNLANHGNEDGGTRAFFVGVAVALVVAAILFMLVVPRWRGSAKTALVLAGLSVLSLAGYWAGLPELFAPAAIAVALGAERRGAAHMIAIAISSVALLAGVFAALFG